MEFFSIAEKVGTIKNKDQLVFFCVIRRNIKVKGR